MAPVDVGVRIQALACLELGYTPAQIEAYLGVSSQQYIDSDVLPLIEDTIPRRVKRFYLSTSLMHHALADLLRL